MFYHHKVSFKPILVLMGSIIGDEDFPEIGRDLVEMR